MSLTLTPELISAIRDTPAKWSSIFYTLRTNLLDYIDTDTQGDKVLLRVWYLSQVRRGSASWRNSISNRIAVSTGSSNAKKIKAILDQLDPLVDAEVAPAELLALEWLNNNKSKLVLDQEALKKSFAGAFTLNAITAIYDDLGEDKFGEREFSYLRGASGFIYVADGTRQLTLRSGLPFQPRSGRTLSRSPRSRPGRAGRGSV